MMRHGKPVMGLWIWKLWLPSVFLNGRKLVVKRKSLTSTAHSNGIHVNRVMEARGLSPEFPGFYWISGTFLEHSHAWVHHKGMKMEENRNGFYLWICFRVLDPLANAISEWRLSPNFWKYYTHSLLWCPKFVSRTWNLETISIVFHPENMWQYKYCR